MFYTGRFHDSMSYSRREGAQRWGRELFEEAASSGSQHFRSRILPKSSPTNSLVRLCSALVTMLRF